MYVICSKCENVVLPKLGEPIKGKEEVFCSRCDCKYENRNTTIIKVLIALLADLVSLSCRLYNMTEKFMLQIVVIIVIWVISLLVIYMLFLICLDPLLNKRIHKASANIGYHEHNNEEVNMLSILLFSNLNASGNKFTVSQLNVLIMNVLFFFFFLQRMIHLLHLERLIQWEKGVTF